MYSGNSESRGSGFPSSYVREAGRGDFGADEVGLDFSQDSLQPFQGVELRFEVIAMDGRQENHLSEAFFFWSSLTLCRR